MYKFNVEKFHDVVEEIVPLWFDHWEEVATNKDKIPLDPDYEMYSTLEKMGRLLIVTMRDESVLVGYSFMFVGPHIHYKSTKVAQNDILYIKPSHRKGFAGIKLIKYSEEQCKMVGTTKVVWHIKTDHNFGKIMERLGYNLFEVNYGKYIGE